MNIADIVVMYIGFVNQYNNNNSCVIFDDLSSNIKHNELTFYIMGSEGSKYLNDIS